jgi:hypothetical protein
MLLIYLVLLLIIIKMAQSYSQYLREDENFITNTDDFDNYAYKYKKGRLYRIYGSLCDADKLFIRDLICYTMLKYKSERPSFKKMCGSAARQIVGASVLNAAVFDSSLAKIAGQNALGFFVSNVI